MAFAAPSVDLSSSALSELMSAPAAELPVAQMATAVEAMGLKSAAMPDDGTMAVAFTMLLSPLMPPPL